MVFSTAAVGSELLTHQYVGSTKENWPLAEMPTSLYGLP